MCGHVTGVSALKSVPLSSTSLEGLLRGEDMSREICLICTDGLFSVCVCVCEIKRVYCIFSQCLHNTVLRTDVCSDECVCLRQMLSSLHYDSLGPQLEITKCSVQWKSYDDWPPVIMLRSTKQEAIKWIKTCQIWEQSLRCLSSIFFVHERNSSTFCGICENLLKVR